MQSIAWIVLSNYAKRSFKIEAVPSVDATQQIPFQ